MTGLTITMSELTSASEARENRIRELEGELAAANAKIEIILGIAAQLRNLCVASEDTVYDVGEVMDDAK